MLARVDVVVSEKRVDVVAQRTPGVTDVIFRAESSKHAERARQPWKVVEIDQPQVEPVRELPLEVTESAMDRASLVQRRSGHHVTPKACAARTPEAQPSSWKPQPCQAPANCTRPPASAGRASWAATDSGV